MYSPASVIVFALGVASILSSWKITHDVRRWYDSFQEDMFHKYSIPVEATIVSVQERQACKEHLIPLWRWLAPKRAWENSYTLIAEWTPPHTRTTYTFHFLQQKDEQNADHVPGKTITVLVDSRNPASYR